MLLRQVPLLVKLLLRYPCSCLAAPAAASAAAPAALTRQDVQAWLGVHGGLSGVQRLDAGQLQVKQRLQTGKQDSRTGGSRTAGQVQQIT